MCTVGGSRVHTSQPASPSTITAAVLWPTSFPCPLPPTRGKTLPEAAAFMVAFQGLRE